MSDPQSRVGSISRQHAASSAHSVIAPAYERRHIRLAHGIQFHQDQVEELWRVNPYLDSLLSRYPNVEKISNAEYRNHRQRVIFTIEETTDKSVFRRWLETPELHVIYNGHARYGRGPCFGRIEENAMETEDWGEGTNRSTTGAFRLGYPYIAVPASEIHEHGYTAHLLKESEGVPDAADCDPELRPHLRSLRPRTPDELHAGLTNLIRGHQAGDRYLAYRSGGSWKVVHHAGWQNTLSDPNDWGATNVQCRVFCHFGCSTFLHNYPVIRRLAGWTRDGNERYAYWTSTLAYAITYSRWVANLVTYDVENAFLPWADSLAHAVRRTNRDMRAEGFNYRVI
jgi:hypothetical protein